MTASMQLECAMSEFLAFHPWGDAHSPFDEQSHHFYGDVGTS